MASDEELIDPSQPMTVDDAVLLGTRLHRMSLLDEACELYTAVLEADPEHADALHFMGILQHQRHNGALAISYLQRALKQVPNAPGVHHNLGNILLEHRRFAEAAESYERCAELGGETAELLNNIGVLRRYQGHHAAAEAAYVKALQLDSSSVDAYKGYGRVLEAQHRHAEALERYAKALELAPKHAGARHQLSLLLCSLGRFEQAAEMLREWLAADPDNPTAKYYLAACTGEGVPARASDAYVAATFDDLAQSFDARLEALDYRAPELVGAAVRELCGQPDAQLDVLDAGCGTGLCGPLLRPFARRLIGVDLSDRMLEGAKVRGGYDALHKAELTAYIEGHVEAFDLVVSADTLCYFGDLEPVCRAVYRALRPEGRLAFTVEASEGGTFKLHPGGRYSHAHDYVFAALSKAGFRELALRPVVLRTEFGEPVAGHLVSGARSR